MSTLTVHSVAEIPFYEGPHAIEGIRFRHARRTLGVSSWGMNVLDFDPGCEGHPQHDHASDGQEEVYVVLSGAIELRTPDYTYALSAGDLVRVPPNTVRKLVTTDTAARVLALGGTPGAAYEPSPGM